MVSYPTAYLVGVERGYITRQQATDQTLALIQRNPHIRRGLVRAGFTGGWLK